MKQPIECIPREEETFLFEDKSPTITDRDRQYMGDITPYKTCFRWKGDKHRVRVFGHIGEIGRVYKDRADLMRHNVMNGIVAGINGVGEMPAASVVANSGGGYNDCNGDFGEVLIYTGQGGGASRGDQVFSRYNMALFCNMRDRVPLRVIRGFGLQSKYAPAEGYRYDGLYWLTAVWREQEGMTSMIKFRLVRDPWCNKPLPINESHSPVGQTRITRDAYVVMASGWTQSNGARVSGTSSHRGPRRSRQQTARRRFSANDRDDVMHDDDHNENGFVHNFEGHVVCNSSENYELRYIPECWTKVIYEGGHPRFDRYTNQGLLHGLGTTVDYYPLEYHSAFIAYNQWESMEPQFLWKQNWRRDEWTEFPIKSHPNYYALDDVYKRSLQRASSNGGSGGSSSSNNSSESVGSDNVDFRREILEHSALKNVDIHGFNNYLKKNKLYLVVNYKDNNNKLINNITIRNKNIKIVKGIQSDSNNLNLADFFKVTKDLEDHLKIYHNVHKALLHKLILKRKALIDSLSDEDLLKLYLIQKNNRLRLEKFI